MCEEASTSSEQNDFCHRIGIAEKSKSIKMTKSSNHRVRGESGSKDEAEYVADPAMKAEIEAAVGFLTDFLVKAPKQEFSQESVDLFRRSLESVLYRRYNGHWHSATPLRGSGFRCLRINGKLDPVVAIAAEASRLPLRKVRQAFPAELTVWVDPGDVSVRFGEEGSVGVWYATRRTGEEESKTRPSEDHHQQQAYPQQMYQRSSPTLSSTPPGSYSHPPAGGYHRVQYQASPIQYQRQQSSPVWSPLWQQQQMAASPQQNRSSPSSFVTSSGNNGFVMALNHQQQQMQLRQHQQTPTRYNAASSPSSRVSPQPTNDSTAVEGEEQRCKMLAERLMRENLNLMASLAPGLVSSRPQPVGVGVN